VLQESDGQRFVKSKFWIPVRTATHSPMSTYAMETPKPDVVISAAACGYYGFNTGTALVVRQANRELIFWLRLWSLEKRG